MLKFSKDRDEMSYPFIYETSALCDYEILSDELCTVVGIAGSECTTRDQDLKAQLFTLQPQIFDLNGSIRGQCTIGADELQGLKSILQIWRNKLEQPTQHFVLPRGTGVVARLHYARSLSKKITRTLVHIDQEGLAIPSAVPAYTNVLTNLFFAMSQVINQREQVQQPTYVSRNYGVRVKKG